MAQGQECQLSKAMPASELFSQAAAAVCMPGSQIVLFGDRLFPAVAGAFPVVLSAVCPGIVQFSFAQYGQPAIAISDEVSGHGIFKGLSASKAATASSSAVWPKVCLKDPTKLAAFAPAQPDTPPSAVFFQMRFKL